jgi:eukaryotic-like serine/threonine-protein kinase
MSDASVVEAVFSAALKKASAQERAAYVQSACADDAALRREVEKLLRAHARMGAFLMGAPAEQFAAALTAGGAGDALRDTVDDFLASLQPATMPDALGRVGHYEILEVLGRGGFGIVFRAMDEVLQRMVAVKVLAPQLAATPSARQRFLAEARAAAKIRHTNVVQVHAVAEGALPYLVMELIPGESLQQRVNRTGRLAAQEVASIGRQIAEGLAASHRLGIIHRDVKPENILLEPGTAGQVHVKISDFGLARAVTDAHLTQFGVVAGTPMFMSPEQARGEALDPRSDLFSLGSVLYAMCCGQAPFRGASTFAILRRVVEDPPQPIHEVAPETPLWLCEIIVRLHAKQPEERFTSAQEVADCLGAHLAQPAKPKPDMPAPPKSRSRIGWAIAAAVLLLVSGLGFTEAAGVTDFKGTVIRHFTPEGTLIVQVDDPDVRVQIEGSKVVIQGAGVRKIELKVGSYTVEARKGGKLVKRELVSVTKEGRPVVTISQEPAVVGSKSKAKSSVEAKPVVNAETWQKSLVGLSEDESKEAVIARLKVLNPGYDGTPPPAPLFNLCIGGTGVSDISPIVELPRIQSLYIKGDQLTDLAALSKMTLYRLTLVCPVLTDLSPIERMRIMELDLTGCSQLENLKPLDGMPLRALKIQSTAISDLKPLTGMPLQYFNCDSTKVIDLSPLKEMALSNLTIQNTSIADVSALAGMPLTYLNCCNSHLTDASLDPLKQCKSLKYINLSRTKVSAAAIADLNAALPQCGIDAR